MSRLFKLISYVSAFVLCISCLQEERSPEEILVPTPAQLDCSEAAFSLTSKVPAGSQKLVDECGFLVATTKDLVDAVTVEGLMTENTFAAVLPERRYGTTYYICSYVTNGHGSEIRSDVRSFALDALDKYVTFGKVSPLAYDPSSKVASVGVEADIWAGVSVSEAGLCYGESEELSLEGDFAVGTCGDDGNISVDIEGIVDGEKCFVRPYILDGEYVAYGKAAEFVIPAIPVLVTSDATDVTSEGAVIAGEVVKGADISERGFMLMEGKGSAADMTEKKVVEGTIGEYMIELSELLPNQVYSYCAYAVNPAGTYYGAVKSFTTKVGLPVVASVVASSITSTSATLSAVVKSHGGETVTEVGFYYSTDEAVDIETSTKVNQRYSQDTFEISVDGLQVNTKYYVKSYAKNSAGVGYSDVESFTTSVSSPSVKTVSYSEVTSSSALLTGLVVSDNGAAITERGFVWVKGSDTPTTDSNKLKVDGTTGEYTYTLEGLESNQKFSFRAYAINSKGTSYGEIMNFSTVAGLAELSATRVSGVTERSATFTCTVTDHGGVTVSEVGFYYSTDENMDMSTAKKVSETYSSDSFTFSVSELEVGTTYYVKAFAVNSAGEVQNAIASFKTVSLPPEVNTVGYSKVSATSVQLSGKVLTANGENITDRGFVWAEGGSESEMNKTLQVLGAVGEFSGLLEGIEPNKTYVFRAYATNAKGTAYGEVMEFNINVNLPSVTTNNVTEISDNAAKSGGVITDDGGGEILAKGVVWSKKPNPTVDLQTKTEDGEGLGSFTSSLTDLSPGYTYYVRAYATNEVGTAYGDTKTFTTTGEIQSVPLEAANSFIISYPDVYSFKTVKGNSSESVGDVATAEVLWETFGTEENIETGDLIAFASYNNGTITFATADDYREGNALIAAKDASGTILWSWHIWLTDQPEEHIYPNNAGTMMDRNLGATSATPGDVGALGLLYQWGRKDPFLGSASITENVKPASSGEWKDPEILTAEIGTIDFTIKNPMSFIATHDRWHDWHFYQNDTRWQSEKTIYDPCPAGWRVPDGGDDGVWNVAGFSYMSYDYTNRGFSFSISSPSTTWYPTTGRISDNYGDLTDVGNSGAYWSAITGDYAEYFYFDSRDVKPIDYLGQAWGFSVRCFKEGTGGGVYTEDFSTAGAVDLSNGGTANSYIVTSAGTYSIPAVKGNSYESVGSVSSVQILWESFGTDEKPRKGSLVRSAKYENDKVYFITPDSFREGNVVIAAKDASGTILWSWHIWLTDQPQEHIYPNNAGIMMDRNLGATSATPGDVGALGLLYQWGRKDPFLGAGTMEGASPKSTGMWEAPAVSDASNGTIERAIEHPTQFIFSDEKNLDWQYIPDNTRWQSEKTMYDPCPVGWRVPDGGENGVWSTAGFSKNVYDGANEGMSFDITSPATTWYPAAGHLTNHGDPSFMNGNAYYWSVAIAGEYAYSLYFHSGGGVDSMFPAYRSCAFSVRCQKEGTGGGPQYDNDFSTSGATHLSTAGTANSYIVSGAGTYSIAAVMGNSYESVGSVDSAEVLWESFGTDEKVTKGDLVAGAKYEDGLIYFKTADSYREGNAVIAAKDASGTILWSWHIWLTDHPQEQIYYNNAGTMMDRNLGATSAEPGSVGALGLMYQWGRKDPFLGSSSISGDAMPKSSTNWMTLVESDYSTGTIEYAISHPTTFITNSDGNADWYYTGSNETDKTRWTSDKTIYDPCPAGWRVPDGGSVGVWSTAKGSSSEFYSDYDNSNRGIDFSGEFGDDVTIWYPNAGALAQNVGNPCLVAEKTCYLSLYPEGDGHALDFNKNGNVNPMGGFTLASGCPVRCQKEGTGGGLKYDNNFSTSGAAYLSSAGTANSYIVSSAGTYRIDPVKGNSSESVGPVESAVVLWESYGTRDHYDYINKADLIAGARYDGGSIYFKTADEFREGNAVIAAKDASGTILWSWHIWMTDRPEEHTYPNNAGVMMDRNLGATSAEPGSAGALGLLYQWGRKDPFLNSYAPNFSAQAPATINWPSPVTSSPSEGTIDYAVKHPTTFIYAFDYGDWCYSTSAATDVTRWQSEKTKYDPCPVGWRVPDGGLDGVWVKADFANMSQSSANFGISFNISNPATTWYPAAGHGYDLDNVGVGGFYWAANSIENHHGAYAFEINTNGTVNSDYGNDKAFAFSVRCFKEDSGAQPTIPGPDEYWASEVINLAVDGTANCYIVSESGAYGFPTVPGNLYSPVGQVASAEVLWESFGTDEKPSTGDLIKEVLAKGSMIYFKTSDTFREGNAVIAAKDPSGTILWSWHIWLTDQPEEQVYYNNAGTMMDRNLGATSATPGDVGALGLLYQWGRKDPFLGSSSIHPCIEAKSTISWPSVEVSNPSSGTIQYATEHPTTVISGNAYNGDWYYTGFASTDDTRWNSMKTIYDPCPVGYRVPDGGERGIWNVAGFSTIAFDPLNRGYSFSISSPSVTWYPAAGCLHSADGFLCNAGDFGHYWSATAEPYTLYSLYLYCFDDVRPVTSDAGSTGLSVRCQKE